MKTSGWPVRGFGIGIYAYVRTGGKQAFLAAQNANASKGAFYNRKMAAGKRGKPESFTPEENAAMREELRKLRDVNRWTQAEAGSRIGVSQQTAAKLLAKNSRAGFSRPTALELARILGYDSPETLLEELGSLAGPERIRAGSGGWRDRDFAAGLARRGGVNEEAIERVMIRYSESQYISRRAPWWMERFAREHAELEEQKAAMAAPPPSTPMLEAPEPKTRTKKKIA